MCVRVGTCARTAVADCQEIISVTFVGPFPGTAGISSSAQGEHVKLDVVDPEDTRVHLKTFEYRGKRQ